MTQEPTGPCGRSNESGPNDAEGPARQSGVSLRLTVCIMASAADSESTMQWSTSEIDNACWTIARLEYGSVLVSRVRVWSFHEVCLGAAVLIVGATYGRRHTILTYGDEKH